MRAKETQAAANLTSSMNEAKGELVMPAAGTQAAALASTDEVGLQVHEIDPERKAAFGQFMTPFLDT